LWVTFADQLSFSLITYNYTVTNKIHVKDMLRYLLCALRRF
jgi:hypothetical protein